MLVLFSASAALEPVAGAAIPVRLARTTLITVSRAERVVTTLFTTLAEVLCDSTLMSREAFTTHPMMIETWGNVQEKSREWG